MTKRLILVILCLCCIGWLTLIFHLSTEDGEKTADTSIHIAEKISGVLYSSPTVEQTAGIHYMVRKAAHVILFFCSGSAVSPDRIDSSTFLSGAVGKICDFCGGALSVDRCGMAG